MTRLYLVRHGRPLSSYADDRDPPLHPEGVTQAEAAARTLLSLGPLPLISSPLIRCRQTAAPLESLWNCAAEIEPAVRELPSPGRDGAERAVFINTALQERWRDLLQREPDLRPWYEGLLTGLMRLKTDTVVFSHYVAINAVVGRAQGKDDVSCFRPGHASVTIVEQDHGRFRLVSLGAEAVTRLTSG